MAQQSPPGALIFHPRSHHNHHADPDMSSSSFSTSSDDTSIYQFHPPRRRRGRRSWRWPWPPVMFGYPGLARGTTAFIPQTQHPQQQPRQYGYRRFHYQGGEHRSRGTHHHTAHHCHRRGRPQRQCVLTRCCRWLFGGPPQRCCREGRDCGAGAGAGGECCSRAASPTRHYEDEYWGPGRGSSNNWACGPTDWHDSPWRYGSPGGNGGYPHIGPGGTVEEIGENTTAPAPTATLPVATGILTSDRDVQHNHYHDHSHRRRRSDRYAEIYEGLRGRERRDGFLGLMDRERDREMDRHIINQDALNAREARTLALLDRERGRDRGDTTVMDLLDRELNRRRGMRPGKDADSRDGDSEAEGERGQGLRREIEALRRDLSRLTTCQEGKTAKKTKGKREDSGAGRDRGRGEASRSASRGQTSAA